MQMLVISRLVEVDVGETSIRLATSEQEHFHFMTTKNPYQEILMPEYKFQMCSYKVMKILNRNILRSRDHVL